MADEPKPFAAPEPQPNEFRGTEEQGDGSELANEILQGEAGGAPPSEPRPVEPKPPAPPAEPPYVTKEFIEEREKRQKAEEEVKQWRDWRAEVEKAQAKPQAPAPDPFLQPAEYVEQQIQSRMNTALQPITQVMSQLYHQNQLAAAKRQYGDEVAEKAYQEFDKTTMPRAEWESVVSAPNPFAAAVEWKRRRDTLAAIGDDPATFEQKLREKLLSDPQFLADMRAKMTAPANGADPHPPPAPQPSEPVPRDDAGRFVPRQQQATIIPSVNRAGPAKSAQPRGFEALANQSDEDLVDEILNAPSRR